MPANLLSSSSFLSGTVVVMLLLWLCGSALMTLRVGAKNQQITPAPARAPGEPDRFSSTEQASDLDDEPLSVELADQPVIIRDPQAGGAASSLGLTRGQRAAEHAGPEMAFLAASADS